MDPNVRLLKEPDDADLSEMRDIPYQAAIGTLMYAALGTRPDISYAVQALSQFSSRPGPAHWTAVKRVFRYLKGTLDYGMTYGRKGETHARAYYRNLRLEGYSDADWGANPVDRKSISGYAFLIGSGVIAWSSKKQAVVALSSTEAEYMAISYAARHAIWMRTLLAELTFAQEQATKLNADNQSAIALSKDSVHHARSKHIDIRHHFIRECIESDTIALAYVPTDDNVADLFTKALARERFHMLRRQLGILSDAELRGSVGDNGH
ncbi:Copia protein [Trametes pubescens]|uniref:Copia protein n=1 Tax=Trametes pubescens TaxID=154538 RepID=A0A1M2V968_TRAPU|nr:Copia protein [Trametes pubescens]